MPPRCPAGDRKCAGDTGVTVYVDDMQAAFGRMVMCHMIADSDEELHEMASRIGVARRWHQKPPKASSSHYDICLSRRALAVRYGAIEITLRQAAAMAMRRRVMGSLGEPATAIEWVESRKNCQFHRSKHEQEAEKKAKQAA